MARVEKECLLISITDLEYTYPGTSTPALHNISLEVPQGPVTVIAGESGSGKTTLLRLIAGFLVPEAGRISIGGRRVSDASGIVAPEERSVGVVFQDFALFPHLTVEANVVFGIGRRPKREREARVIECLELLGIEHLAARFPHELSGGQAQRVAVARTLAPSPRIIVMDEPFNNLNVALRHELVPVVAEVLRSTGITAVVVTHDPHEAYELADQMLLLKDGALEQGGTARDLYERPTTRYVAHFFGPVNEVDPSTQFGAKLRAQSEVGSGPVLPATEHGTLVLRPEQIVLTSPGAGIAAAEVKSVRFAGDHLVAELVCSEWPGSLRAHVPKTGLSPGATVGIRIGAVDLAGAADTKQ